MRLLLAEDERELARALETILTHNGYTVDRVDNGEDALSYGRGGDYDAMILDIMMPRMDGLTVVSRLREGGIATPVMLLTARSMVEDRIQGLDAGADDYLTKPFATGELLARLRALTRRRGDYVPDRMTCGDLSLDRGQMLLTGPEGEQRLSSREFKMMELLMENRPRLISTEQFMDRVWGYDTQAGVNGVWVYISALRKKMTLLGSRVQIVAVRGAGYRLEGPDD